MNDFHGIHCECIQKEGGAHIEDGVPEHDTILIIITVALLSVGLGCAAAVYFGHY